jgi:hypothetical protein
MSKNLLKGVFAAAFALAIATPAAAQDNASAGSGGAPEAAAGVQFKAVGAHSLEMIAKYLCKDPTGTTNVIGISIADDQAAGDAWRAIASVGTGAKIATNTNYSNPNVSGSFSTRAPTLGVLVFPPDATVGGKTATVLATPANDFPAGFTFPSFDATGSLRVTYNGGGPSCVRKQVLLGSATP